MWQPIATAPKDGTPILAYCGDGWRGAEIYSIRFADYGCYRSWQFFGTEERLEWSEPTHWMPLPNPPK